MLDTNKASVATPTGEWAEMEAKRRLCRVLMVGTGHYGGEDGSFLAGADLLLPQYASEHPADYQFRRDHLTVVPPDFPDSVDAVTSSILNGPVVIVDTEPWFYDYETQTGHWINIDRQGRSGDAFLASVGTESIAEGLPWVFVDWWNTDDQSAEARPYWTIIHAKDCIETCYVDGMMVRARWLETVTPPMGADQWSVKPIERVRVLYRGDGNLPREQSERYARFETWVKVKDKWLPQAEPMFEGDVVEGYLTPPANLPDELAREFVEIPLYPFYSGYRRPGVSWPVLRHQAELVRLWALMNSDFASAHHYAMNPRDVIVGTDEQTYSQHNPGNTPAGQGNLTFLPRNADWKILSHDGAAFASTQAFLDKLAERIQAAGIETLRAPATGRELATLGLLERERKLTRLEVVSMFWQNGLSQCARRHQLLMGVEPQMRLELPPPNKDLLVSPQSQLKLLEVGATHDLIDPQTFWELARDISGAESITPEDITLRVAEYRRSLGPMP